MEKPWCEKILDYHFNLDYKIPLPEGISFIDPYSEPETRRCMQLFYGKYYNDRAPRTLLIGINPGRFGAGITGVPFTDPVRLEESCGISNAFEKRQELSSAFIYAMIDALGGAEAFFSKYYITSVFPLGFLRAGKNFNYYDSPRLKKDLEPHIARHLRHQLAMGGLAHRGISLGKGENFKVLQHLNAGYRLFESLVALPHPRWIMQYRLKQKAVFIDEYVRVLSEHSS